jgi:uncharacterized membrane protein
VEPLTVWPEREVDMSQADKASDTSASAATGSLRQVDTAPISLAAPIARLDRMLACAGYFGALAGFWLVIPAIAYAWRGRQSRFVGFHAVQAVLLQVAAIPIVFFGIGVSGALSMWISMSTGDKFGHAPLAKLAEYAVLGVVFTIPAATTLWLGFSALRGKPRSLPLLGRWANNVVKDVEKA